MGTWEVCTDVNFGNVCRTIDASSGNLGLIRMNDNISSLRRISGGGRGSGGNRGGGRDNDDNSGRRDRDDDRNTGRNRGDQNDQGRGRGNQNLLGGPTADETSLPPGIRAVRRQQR